MATVVLFGNGPLPDSEASYLSFPQLRFEQFLKGLILGGHTVLVVSVEASPLVSEIEGEGWKGITVKAESTGWLEKARGFISDSNPDCVVAAGPYNSVRLATMACGDLPLWVDIPGDPFAEAQVKDALNSSTEAMSNMAATYASSYARGDRFSAISCSQRNALLGQLGLSGRLACAPLGHEWVSVVEGAYAFGEVIPRGEKQAPGDKFVVALVGGYNTWLDGETILEGLLLAMDRNIGLYVVSTGGAIPNHHNETYERFLEGALSSRHSERFSFHGWLPHTKVLTLLEGADVGLTMDRVGIEAQLGARTRVIFFFHRGLDVVTTTGSDFTKEMVNRGFAHGVGVEDVEGLAVALGKLVRGNERGRVSSAQSYLESRHSIEQLSVELNDWVSAPLRVESVETPLSLVSSELESVRSELREVYSSITWRVLGRLFRTLKRMFRG